jgi:hypothetical protein
MAWVFEEVRGDAADVVVNLCHAVSLVSVLYLVLGACEARSLRMVLLRTGILQLSRGGFCKT